MSVPASRRMPRTNASTKSRAFRCAVSNSLYASGGQLALDGTVGRNARIAGGRVEIDPRAIVAGNVSIAGGEVRIDGAVKGYVQAAGGRVLINGTIGGDVVATSGAVELGPNARIAGDGPRHEDSHGSEVLW